MPSPFPGMDPYVEWPVIWKDFHNRLIVHLQELLQPLLRPRYVALSEERLFVVDSDRPIYPDLGILRASTQSLPHGSAAVLEADAPALFSIDAEEIREPFLEIIEPAAGNRVITAIEVLSPDNKSGGAGRTSYLKKREELWNNGANLIEIDLLREGQPTVWLTAEQRDSIRPWHYLVVASRRSPARHEVYAVPLQRRLPGVFVPLANGDSDIVLDLQTAFARTWDGGPYPELLRYDEAPPGRIAPEDVAWCDEIVRNAGYRQI